MGWKSKNNTLHSFFAVPPYFRHDYSTTISVLLRLEIVFLYQWIAYKYFHNSSSSRDHCHNSRNINHIASFRWSNIMLLVAKWIGVLLCWLYRQPSRKLREGLWLTRYPSYSYHFFTLKCSGIFSLCLCNCMFLSLPFPLSLQLIYYVSLSLFLSLSLSLSLSLP